MTNSVVLSQTLLSLVKAGFPNTYGKYDLSYHSPITAVQRTRLGTTNAVEILLTGKKCNFNVSFILMEISRVLFSGGYGITRVFFFCPNFRL